LEDRTQESIAPFLSILVPAYNAQDTVRQTIESILSQTGVLFELILVDDGSTDDTADVILSAIEGDNRTRLIRQENQGTGGALKTAASHAVGEWLLMLGADDYLPEGAFERRIAFMDENPGFDIYSTDFYYAYEDGRLVQAPDWGKVRSITLEELLTFPHISGSSMFRRALLEDIGGFRLQFFNEDYDLWLRMLAHGAKHIHQPEPLEYYRIHDGQKTTDAIKLRTDDIAILTDLINSGLLTDGQAQLAHSTIATHKRNTLIRKMLYAILGKKAGEAVVKAMRS